MAEQSASDLFMMFVYKRSPIKGESRAQINLGSNPLTKDFKQDCMFEVQNFTLKTGLESEDDETKEQNRLKEDQAKQKAELEKQKRRLEALHQNVADVQAQLDRLSSEMRKHVRDMHAAQTGLGSGRGQAGS